MPARLIRNDLTVCARGNLQSLGGKYLWLGKTLRKFRMKLAGFLALARPVAVGFFVVLVLSISLVFLVFKSSGNIRANECRAYLPSNVLARS
jgi:hypothetical protein